MRQAFIVLMAALLSGIACGPVHPQVHADFLDGLRHGATLTVFPAAVHAGPRVTYDAAAADRIAGHLRQRGIAATPGSAHVPLPVEWQMNEDRMAQDSAAALATYVNGHPITTRYALLPEYLVGPGNRVGGVHSYVVRDDGPIAGMMALNSHSPLFQAAPPSTAADCTRLVVSAVDERWLR